MPNTENQINNPIVFEEHNGVRVWTKWVQPLMKGYLFKCCDCGLVHEMQFRSLKREGKMTKAVTWAAEGLDIRRYRVEFRVRRRDDI